MNSLARAILSPHLISSSPSSAKPLFHLFPRIALQQCRFLSTKTTRTTTQKVQQLTKPKTQKSSASASGFSQGIKKQAEALTTVWPKPREMPYQAKVANFVNLIGYVEIPVQFEAASDGKHFATTLISLKTGNGKNSLSIKVVFEGDLAHVVACHVKENSCVFVSGQLSVDSTSVGKFHVVAENLKFVEGFEKNVVDKKTGVAFSGLEIDKSDNLGLKMTEEVLEQLDNVYFNQQSRVVLYSARKAATLEGGNDEPILETSNEKSGVSKKKDMNEILDLWRDLVKSPLQWWDYRRHKSNGLVKEKFPDFKQKVTGKSLWISTAPNWILPGLGKLEFDVKDVKPNQEGHNTERTSTVKLDDSWKNLVENPGKWWDNRMKKKNPKAPDFRHKETGEALWLDKSPAWALSRIPPV